MYKVVFVVCCLNFSFIWIGWSQQIINDIEFQEISVGFPEYEYLQQTPSGAYIIALEKMISDQQGLVVGATLIPAYHHYPDDGLLGLSDFFLCKMSSNYDVLNSFTIDNAEVVRDIFAGNEYTLISMNLHEDGGRDSFPILLNGHLEIPREGNLQKGVVIILDSNLVFQRYLFPSTGEIGNIAVFGNVAYFELRIPDREPYIIVGGQDTIFNQIFSDSSVYGLQTVVLCRYDLDLDEFRWTVRLGNVGYEILDEMLIDLEGSLIILGETSSTYFTFNDQDTVLNMSNHNPFIGTYSWDGEFLRGFLNPFENNISATDLLIDSDNSLFWIGFYRGDAYQTEDTLLVRPGLGRPYRNQGLLTKYSSDGENDWVMQLEGDFEQSIFYSATEIDVNRLAISGLFDTGSAILGDSLYLDDETVDDYYNFIFTVDKSNGSTKSHLASQINSGPALPMFLYGNTIEQLDLFMYFQGSESLFSKPFESFKKKISGWLIKLSTDFLLRSEPTYPSRELTIFPNPCHRGDLITVQDSINLEWPPRYLKVIDTNGRMLISEIPFSDTRAIIPTEILQPGIYWIVEEKQNIILGEIIIIK